MLVQAEQLARKGFVAMNPRYVTIETFDERLVELTPQAQSQGMRIRFVSGTKRLQ
jgi:hypothetical protein